MFSMSMASFLPLSADKLASYPQEYHHRCTIFPRRGCYVLPLRSNLLGSHSSTKKKIKGGAYVTGCMSPIKQDYAITEDDEVKRPIANFPPYIWGDRFDNFTLEDQLSMERYTKEVEPLKEEVRMMLLDNSSDLEMKMGLIDAVERLGYPYYYENEINELLNQIFKEYSGKNFNVSNDLSSTAVQYRIFRQHGYNMPCDVFNKFIDDEGKFKETLKSDERGMISLYEAAHLRVHGEYILEDALVFTTEFLKSIASFSEQAHQALLQPLHTGIQRVQIRQYISFYMKDEFRNEKLLQLAKTEFNRLQLLHRLELSQLQKWWKNFDFVGKYPYMKHRSVELHFSAIVMCYEPRYSFTRILLSQIMILINVLDDTCDAYATFEEIQQLADAVERWDLNSTEKLPVDYLNNVYACVIETWDELAKEMTKRGKSYARHYLKEQFQLLMRGYLLEAKWLAKRYQPTFEEYMAARRVTIVIRISVTAALLGMEEVRDVKPLEQLLQADLKALMAGETISGLLDDIATGEAEIARGGRNVTSIECYMKDYNMSREAVLQEFKKMNQDRWKDMNSERLLINDSDLSSKRLFEQILGYTRGATAFFRVGDGFTIIDHGSIKEDIIATYAKPFLV